MKFFNKKKNLQGYVIPQDVFITYNLIDYICIYIRSKEDNLQ